MAGMPGCGGASIAGAKVANTAPSGSARTENRPTCGMSCGATSTVAPSSVARAVVASTSGVPIQASQWGGAPAAAASSGSSITPPIGCPSRVNMS